MDPKKLIAALGRMKVETGSLVCFGCGHEHNCGVRGCALIRAAQETLSTLQAETEKLRAELEQVKRERDAAQSLLAERTGVMGAEPITTAFGLALDRLRELAQAELEQVKADRSRALDDVPDPIAADERQTSPGRQWDWLLRRFTRREQDG